MRPPKFVACVLFLALLIPSAWFAWQNRDMPQLGRGHDDAIYLTVAKSLVDGNGYRIQNLPGAPYETKYPPVGIWLLMLVWWINPEFPANLPVATVLQWAMIPPFLWLTAVWLKRVGLSERARWGALTLLAVSPYTVGFGAGIYTEVLFGVLLLGSLLACERTGWRWAVLAGVLAGLAYWTRTAGIVALVSAPAVFLWRKQRREAAAYFGAAFAFVASWILWIKLNQSPMVDAATSYNADYAGFALAKLQFSDLRILVWENFGRMLYAIGGLALPLETGSMFLAMMKITVAVGILHGLWLHRANRMLAFFGAFAALTVAELLVWHYPPNLRLMYPMVPLMLAGLVWEAQHFADMLRKAFAHRDSSQRIAAKLVGAAAAGFAVYGVWMQGEMSFSEMPAQARQQEEIRAEGKAAFTWIAEHADPQANVICVNPALYLYSGHRTQSLYPYPIFWYRGDFESLLEPIRSLPAHGAAYPMEYLYMHEFDYDLLAPGRGEEARRMVESNPGLTPVFRNGRGVVYQLASTEAARR